MREVEGAQAEQLKGQREWWWLLFALYLALSAVFVYYGKVARDEGWYLYAGWAVRQGQMPYRDFPYFQSPLLPYVYSVVTATAGQALNLGRAFSWLAGAIAVFLTVRLARRQAGNLAAGLVGICFISSSYALFHLTYVSNLALSSCLAVLAMYCLFRSRERAICAIVAVVSAMLAVAVRLSFLPYAALVLFVALWENRHRIRQCIVLLASAAGVGAICFLPFLLTAPAELFFNLVTAQAVRRGQHGATLAAELVPPGWQWAALSFSLFAFGLGLCLTGLIACAGRRDPVGRRVALLAVAAAVAYLPNLAPGDIYPNYLVPALPFLACGGAIGVASGLRHASRLKRTGAVAWLATLLIWSVFASAVVLPRYMSLGAPQRDMAVEAAEYIAGNVPDSEQVFTFETVLAVLAQRPVMPGMEMSYFSFFPDWATPLCRQRHLLNDELAEEGLASGSFGAVALTDFDLFLLKNRAGLPKKNSTDLLNQFSALNSSYSLVQTVTDFGIFMDNLYVFIPNSEGTKEVSIDP